jgi:hypothetical protein
MIWVYIYLFIGTAIGFAGLGMVKGKIKFLTIIGILIPIFFWPWVIFWGIGKAYRERE